MESQAACEPLKDAHGENCDLGVDPDSKEIIVAEVTSE